MRVYSNAASVVPDAISPLAIIRGISSCNVVGFEVVFGRSYAFRAVCPVEVMYRIGKSRCWLDPEQWV